MKRLSCLLGHHEWTTTVERGESLTTCTACGAARSGGGAGNAARDDLLSAKHTGESNKSISSRY